MQQRSPPGLQSSCGSRATSTAEESGTDASLQVLYDLAARTDCPATQILDEAVVVIMPTQNPDGREAETRRNFYGFDMNRDWFARTQPETDGKLEVIREYPPVLFIDAHEMGAKTYFFPPTPIPSTTRLPRRRRPPRKQPRRRRRSRRSATKTPGTADLSPNAQIIKCAEAYL